MKARVVMVNDMYLIKVSGVIMGSADNYLDAVLKAKKYNEGDI